MAWECAAEGLRNRNRRRKIGQERKKSLRRGIQRAIGCPRVDGKQSFYQEKPGVKMGSVVKKRRRKISKHKYRKRLKANRHKKR